MASRATVKCAQWIGSKVKSDADQEVRLVAAIAEQVGAAGCRWLPAGVTEFGGDAQSADLQFQSASDDEAAGGAVRTRGELSQLPEPSECRARGDIGPQTGARQTELGQQRKLPGAGGAGAGRPGRLSRVLHLDSGSLIQGVDFDAEPERQQQLRRWTDREVPGG